MDDVVRSVYHGDGLGERLIDRCATDDDRDGQMLVCQLFHDKLHLLGGGDQERREGNGISLFLYGGGNDAIYRTLLAKVDDAVAIVGQDGLHQVLTDVMDVPEDCR